MAKARLLARIITTVLVVALGTYSAHVLFPELVIIQVLLAATVLVATLARPRIGLGIAVITSAIAIAQNPSSLTKIILLVIASMISETGYELLAEKSLVVQRECNMLCRYTSIASLSVVYGSILAATYLGAVLLAKLYDAVLAMRLPGALEEFWQLASRSIIVRIAIYTSMIAIIYWVSSRLIAPLLQALAAPGYALHRLLISQFRLEKSLVEKMDTWYHRILPRVLGVLVGFFVSPIAYPVAMAILKAIRIEEPGVGIEALMTAAVAWLMGIIGYNIGYSAARAITKGINWKKTAIAGALALLSVIVITAALSKNPLGYLYSETKTLVELASGGTPQLNDPALVSSLYTRVEGLEKYYRSMEELLRFLAKLFWG